MHLKTPRLLLREFCLDDYPAVREFTSDPEMFHYEPGPLTEEETRRFLLRAEAWAGEQPRHHYQFALTLPPEELARGRISLTLINSDIDEWEIGWFVHRKEWGKGYACEAAAEVLRFAFQHLHAHRVVAFCNAGNEASRRVMQKLGMRQDGLLRQTRRWGDGWADEYVYAILEQDWRPDA